MSSSWHADDGGPGRKYFDLTAAGRRALHARSALWEPFVEGRGDSSPGHRRSDDTTLAWAGVALLAVAGWLLAALPGRPVPVTVY